MTRERSLRAASYLALGLCGAAMSVHLALWTRSLTLSVGALAAPGRSLLAGLCLGTCAGALLGNLGTRVPATGNKILAMFQWLLALICAAMGLTLHLGAHDLALWVDPWISSTGPLAGSTMAFLCSALPGALLGLLCTAALGALRGKPNAWSGACAMAGATALGAALGLTLLYFLMAAVTVTSLLAAASAIQFLGGALWLLRPEAQAAALPPSPGPIEPGRDARTWALVATTLAATAAAGCLMVVGRQLGACFLAPDLHPDMVLAILVLAMPGAFWLLAATLMPRLARRAPGSRTGSAALLACLGIAAPLALRLLARMTAHWDMAAPPPSPWLSLLAAAGLLALTLAPLGLTACLLAARSCSLGRNGPTLHALLALAGLGAGLGIAWTTFMGMADVGAMAAVSVAALACLAVALANLADHFQAGGKATALLVLCLIIAGLILLPPPPHPALAGIPGQQLFRSQDASGLFVASLKPEQTVLAVNDLQVVQEPLDTVAQAHSQQFLGHLGPAYAPEAQSALVLGSGNLASAGVLASYPRLVRMDVVEALPATIDALDVLGPAAYLANEARTAAWHADSPRRFLAACSDTYDLILVSTPQPGVDQAAPLYSLEALAFMRNRLNPGGVLVIRAQEPWTASILAGVRATFGNVAAHDDPDRGLLLVASDTALDMDPFQVRWLASDPMVAEVLRLIGVEPGDMETMLTDSVVSSDDLPSEVRPATDDLPVLGGSPRPGRGFGGIQ